MSKEDKEFLDQFEEWLLQPILNLGKISSNRATYNKLISTRYGKDYVVVIMAKRRNQH